MREKKGEKKGTAVNIYLTKQVLKWCNFTTIKKLAMNYKSVTKMVL